MNNPDKFDYKSTKAYHIFLDELRQNLELTQNYLIDNNRGPEMTEELKLRFHRLRGSASLFGHDRLGNIAGEIEDLISKSLKNVTSKAEQIEELLLNLQACLNADLEKGISFDE